MSQENIGILVVAVILLILIIPLGKLFFRLIGISAKGKSREQLEIARRAFSQATDDDERWHEIGKTARRAKKKGGCLGWLIIIGIIIVAILAILSQIQK